MCIKTCEKRDFIDDIDKIAQKILVVEEQLKVKNNEGILQIDKVRDLEQNKRYKI